MIRGRRLAILGVLGIAAALSPAGRPAATSHAAGFAGQWNALLVEQCDRNPANETLCNNLLVPWLGRALVSFQANCDAAGTCTFTEAVSWLGVARGAPTCTLGIATTPFSSFCTAVFSGHAVVGQTGLVPTFRVTDEDEYFYGNPFSGAAVIKIHNPLPKYPFDTGIPAVSGVFPDTTKNLQLLGVLPAGVSAPPGATFAGVISQQGAAGTVVLWFPLPPTTDGPGTSHAFVVGWFSANPGSGQVDFGPGPGCSGLVETATSDLVPRATAHIVVVSGNDLPGTVGDVGILAGASYQFRTVTVTGTGTEINANSGTCHTAQIPA